MQKHIKKIPPNAHVKQYHDTDFYRWTREQMGHLRKKEYEKLDITHLLEEIKSLGNSERNAMDSYFVVMLVHLLKWKYQPVMQCNSWKNSIKQSEMRIERIINKNPSLKREMAESLEWAYTSAVLEASSETGLEISTFPEACPWTVEELFPDLFKKMKKK